MIRSPERQNNDWNKKSARNFEKISQTITQIFKIEILAKGTASFLFQPIDSFQSFFFLTQ